MIALDAVSMTRHGYYTLTIKSSDYLQAICPPHGGLRPGLGRAVQCEVGALRQACVGCGGADSGLHARPELELMEELPRLKVRL